MQQWCIELESVIPLGKQVVEENLENQQLKWLHLCVNVIISYGLSQKIVQLLIKYWKIDLKLILDTRFLQI